MCGRHTLTYRDEEALARELGIPPAALRDVDALLEWPRVACDRCAVIRASLVCRSPGRRRATGRRQPPRPAAASGAGSIAFTAGSTSLANSRMLRSATSAGIPP